MHVASDNDLKVSLLAADEKYIEVQAKKLERKRAARKAAIAALENDHAAEEKSLRLANKVDKEAGKIRRTREAEAAREHRAREEMADADEDSCVRMALLSEKLECALIARETHARRFDEPMFHFVPRRKMMQIQSGCVATICELLERNCLTNTWQRKDACVVEQCLSALALLIHRRPEAMHSVIRLAARERSNGSSSGGSAGSVLEELLHRGKNLELTTAAAAISMDAHMAIAPLQWICLVCLSGLHALDGRVIDYFLMRNGCQILHRCIRANARHAAVVEQGCRLVAGMSEPSFTYRTRFFAEKIQDAIHKAVFLHGKHRGVQALGTRALDALRGGDKLGLKQKEAAAARTRDST